jgi:hypothetical protein
MDETPVVVQSDRHDPDRRAPCPANRREHRPAWPARPDLRGGRNDGCGHAREGRHGCGGPGLDLGHGQRWFATPIALLPMFAAAIARRDADCEAFSDQSAAQAAPGKAALCSKQRWILGSSRDGFGHGVV